MRKIIILLLMLVFLGAKPAQKPKLKEYNVVHALEDLEKATRKLNSAIE